MSHFGEPFADPSVLPLYYLSRLTREYVTVALNGDGGDEAFAGYQRYWLDPWANRYCRLPKIFTRTLMPAFANALPDTKIGPMGSSFINGLKRLDQVVSIDPRASILRWGSYFSPEWKSRLWRPEYRALLKERFAESYLIEKFDNAHAKTFLDRTLYTDIHSYLPGDLLVKADRMTMAHSLEGRSPFLDHELAEWAARLPDNLKIRGMTGKYLLRTAFADYMPQKINQHGKQGFGIPLGDWFRGELSHWAHETLLGVGNPLQVWFNRPVLQEILDAHTSGRANHSKRIYALVVLALWMQSETL